MAARTPPYHFVNKHLQIENQNGGSSSLSYKIRPCDNKVFIPIIGQLIGTHLTIRLACQGPPSPLKRALAPLKGPLGACKLCICPFLRILGMLYIKIDPNYREKLIGKHHVMRYVCQGHPSSPFRGLRTPSRAPGRPLNC